MGRPERRPNSLSEVYLKNPGQPSHGGIPCCVLLRSLPLSRLTARKVHRHDPLRFRKVRLTQHNSRTPFLSNTPSGRMVLFLLPGPLAADRIPVHLHRVQDCTRKTLQRKKKSFTIGLIIDNYSPSPYHPQADHTLRRCLWLYLPDTWPRSVSSWH